MSGCSAANSSIMPCVSCRLPATSRMFSSTGVDGFSGTLLGASAGAFVSGAPHSSAATSTAVIASADFVVLRIATLLGRATQSVAQLGFVQVHRVDVLVERVGDRGQRTGEVLRVVGGTGGPAHADRGA